MPKPMSEEEWRQCCILGGCGCGTLAARVEAMAQQLEVWGWGRDPNSDAPAGPEARNAAAKLLGAYVLHSRASLQS